MVPQRNSNFKQIDQADTVHNKTAVLRIKRYLKVGGRTSLVIHWLRIYQRKGCGFDSWSGKIPHAAQQLSLCTTTAEPACLEPMLCNKQPLQWEARALPLERSPWLPQLDKSPHSNEDPAQPKISKIFKKTREKICWNITRAGNVKRKQNYSALFVLLHQEECSLIRKEHKAVKPQIMSKAPKLLETLGFSSWLFHHGHVASLSKLLCSWLKTCIISRPINQSF